MAALGHARHALGMTPAIQCGTVGKRDQIPGRHGNGKTKNAQNYPRYPALIILGKFARNSNLRT